jgi:hypothetical protein
MRTDMHNVHITHALHAHGTKKDTTYFVSLTVRQTTKRSLSLSLSVYLAIIIKNCEQF